MKKTPVEWFKNALSETPLETREPQTGQGKGELRVLRENRGSRHVLSLGKLETAWWPLRGGKALQFLQLHQLQQGFLPEHGHGSSKSGPGPRVSAEALTQYMTRARTGAVAPSLRAVFPTARFCVPLAAPRPIHNDSGADCVAKLRVTCSSCFWTMLCCSVTCLSCSASSSGNSRPAFLAVRCLAERAFLDFLCAPICSSRYFCCIWRSCWVSWSHSSYCLRCESSEEKN